MLARERPDDGLLAEEGTSEAGESGRRWVVRPARRDGQLPLRLPALVRERRARGHAGQARRRGVRPEPRRAVRRRARRRRDARRASRSSVREPPPLARGARRHGLRLRRGAARRAGGGRPRGCCRACATSAAPGSAALDLAWLAAGRLDAYYERGLNPWDWAAGSLLVREAGGAVEALQRRAIRPDRGPAALVDRAPPARRGLMDVAVVGGGIVRRQRRPRSSRRPEPR